MGGPVDRQSQLYIGRPERGLTKKSGSLREALPERPLTRRSPPALLQANGNCESYFAKAGRQTAINYQHRSAGSMARLPIYFF